MELGKLTDKQQQGTATVDAYGLVTAPAITINSGAATTLNFSYVPPRSGMFFPSIFSGIGIIR